MSSISSISSLISQYESTIFGDNSTDSTTNSTSTSSLLSELEGTSSSGSSIANGITSLTLSKTNTLSEFYSYASALSSASSTLYSAAKDSSTLSYDDISDFITAYNNLISYASGNTEYISSSDLTNVKEAIANAADSLSSIGITANSDGTLSIDKNTLSSALSSDAPSVAATISDLASATKTAATTLTSNSLANYNTSYKDSIFLAAKISEYEDMSNFIGELLDTKS